MPVLQESFRAPLLRRAETEKHRKADLVRGHWTGADRREHLLQSRGYRKGERAIRWFEWAPAKTRFSVVHVPFASFWRSPQRGGARCALQRGRRVRGRHHIFSRP